MNTNYHRVYKLACLIIATLSMSCGKMDSLYSGFLEEGEFIYPAKADSLKSRSGDYRLELSWVVFSDPNVKQAVIYWDNRRDSLEVVVSKSSRPDTIRVLLTNMEEKSYTFEVFTRDNEGNTSVRSEVLGVVYGDTYRNSLLTRAVRSLFVQDDTLLIDWMPSEENSVGDLVFYKDLDGETHRLFVPPWEDTTRLLAYAPENNFVYQSLFLPDSLAIDTFRTVEFEMEVDPKMFQEIELKKSRFSTFNLPTDTYVPNSATSTMEHIWDGIMNKESPTFITVVGSPMPQWFTFDLGVTAELTRMQINQRGTAANRLYNGGNVKKAEIWGSIDPNSDGSWDDSWVLLGTFDSFKPSGSGDVTSEDIAYALQGEEVVFDGDIPPVRYIRFKTISNWDSANRGFTNIGQLTFWGVEK